MNIQHLRYAVEVERTGSISHAADNLYMNQPNLSKSIKELESDVGTTLFERTSRGMIPTARGREFLRYARNILAQVDEMTALCRQDTDDIQSLRLSVPRSNYIAAAFTDFIKTLDTAKKIDISFLETNSIRTIRNITDEGFNFGIIRYELDHEPYFLNFLQEKDLTYDVLWTFDSVLLLSQDNPLAQRAEVYPNQLTGQIEVTHGDLSVPYLCQRDTVPTPRTPARRIYVYERGSQLDLLTRVPATFMWTDPIPQNALHRYGLVLRPCKVPGITCRDVLIFPKGHQLSAIETSFITSLRLRWQQLTGK